jgi:hypothetical protein
MAEMQELTRRVGSHLVVRPACPNCGRPMHLTRVTPATGAAPDLRTFGCGECGVCLTEAAGEHGAG